MPTAEYQRLWRQKNKEKCTGYMQKWRSKNTEKWNKYMREWNAKHPGYTNDLMKKRYHENKEAMREKQRILRATNPAYFAALEKKRDRTLVRTRNARTRARRKECVGHYTAAQFRAKLKKMKFRCAYCKIEITQQTASADHIIPLAKGGTNWIRNIAPACLPCNTRKSTLTVSEFIAREIQRKLLLSTSTQ